MLLCGNLSALSKRRLKQYKINIFRKIDLQCRGKENRMQIEHYSKDVVKLIMCKGVEGKHYSFTLKVMVSGIEDVNIMKIFYY